MSATENFAYHLYWMAVIREFIKKIITFVRLVEIKFFTRDSKDRKIH